MRQFVCTKPRPRGAIQASLSGSKSEANGKFSPFLIQHACNPLGLKNPLLDLIILPQILLFISIHFCFRQLNGRIGSARHHVIFHKKARYQNNQHAYCTIIIKSYILARHFRSRVSSAVYQIAYTNSENPSQMYSEIFWVILFPTSATFLPDSGRYNSSCNPRVGHFVQSLLLGMLLRWRIWISDSKRAA